MDIDYKTLSARLRGLEDYSSLVAYIFQVQGGELRRLNYAKASEALGVSRRTISRYITQLADKGIIKLIGDCLRINNEILINNEQKGLTV